MTLSLECQASLRYAAFADQAPFKPQHQATSTLLMTGWPNPRVFGDLICATSRVQHHTMLEQIKSSEISPTDYIKKRALTNRDGDDCKPGLIILNQPIADIEVLSRLWNHTGYRLCADGGANQLYDLFVDRPEMRTQFVRKPVPVCSRASTLICTAAQRGPW